MFMVNQGGRSALPGFNPNQKQTDRITPPPPPPKKKSLNQIRREKVESLKGPHNSPRFHLNQKSDDAIITPRN